MMKEQMHSGDIFPCPGALVMLKGRWLCLLGRTPWENSGGFKWFKPLGSRKTGRSPLCFAPQ